LLERLDDLNCREPVDIIHRQRVHAHFRMVLNAHRLLRRRYMAPVHLHVVMETLFGLAIMFHTKTFNYSCLSIFSFYATPYIEDLDHVDTE